MLPIQITVKDIPATPVLESTIRKRAEKLTRYNKRIVSCHVIIEYLQKHKHRGKLYSVRLDVSVPGKELAVTHKFDQDIYIVIREAFEAMERQIEGHTQRQNGHVKTHNNVLHGHVRRMVTEEGYGFIEGADGTEYYFSVTNVSYPDFSQLVIGDAVEYMAHPFSEGWQAHRVVRDKNHKMLV